MNWSNRIETGIIVAIFIIGQILFVLAFFGLASWAYYRNPWTVFKKTGDWLAGDKHDR